MGLIKRALRRTSRKLLSKLIAPASGANSHQLVLNPASSPENQAHEHELMSKRKLVSLQRKLARKARTSKDTAVAEALLLAVKNHLPPLQFHHVHGPHAQLGSNKCVARRTQSFCQALVFSNRVILPNERVYIKVLEISKCWSGTIRFGFTAVDPATLACRMPKHACPDMTNAGHTWARALADDVVRRNSVIHFSYNKHGIIHYGINNQDCGIFHANVSTSQNLWFIVDIYGLTAAVELIDPRVNNSHGSDLSGETRTMYKSTSAMDELFGLGYAAGAGGAQGSRLRQKKQSRKQARQVAALIQQAAAGDAQWPLENHLRSSHTFHNLAFADGAVHPRADYHQLQHPNAMQLPNLNSLSLPSAEQNIYTPMPIAVSQQQQPTPRRQAENDYHQIVNTYTNSLYQPTIRASTSMANINTSHTSSSNETTNSTSIDLSNQLERMNLYGNQRKSTASSQQQTTPVAATRRRQQAGTSNLRNRDDKSIAHQARSIVSSNKSAATASTSSSTSTPSASATKKATSSSATTTSTTTIVKPKTRHSTNRNNNSKCTTILATRDNNDNNNGQPTSKADCPICFERPINCVLYQCGHMCTCYECGVRQWKTGSRTCPICRAVIKDVIKTYKS